MKQLLAVLSACGVLLMQHAESQAITLVSPEIYANAEAPSSSGTFGARQSRALGIHKASEFAAFPPGGAAITAVSFRPDAPSQVGETGGFAHLIMMLSVTQIDPLDISATYDDNITGTPVRVYTGPWTGTVEYSDPPGLGTRPFDFVFPLQSAYWYDPADGNLLIDWIIATTAREPAIRWENDSVNRLPGQQYLFGDADSPDAAIRDFSIVTQFTFTPEPSAAVVAAIVLLGFVGHRGPP